MSMQTDRKVITGGHIITMDAEYGELPQGALLIENGRIAALAENEKAFSHLDAEVIDARGAIVLPGMIDSHRHTWMSLFRGISGDMSLPEFLANTFYGLGALVTAEDLSTATLVGALEAIDSGVTTILDCCDCVNSPDHAVAAIESLQQSGIRGVYSYGFQVYDFQPAGFSSHEERVKFAAELRERYFSDDRGLLRMGTLLSDFGTVPFAQTAAEIRMAQQQDILIASHTGALPNSRLLKGLQELDDHQLLQPGHLHIHCSGLTDPEWRLLARTGAKVSIAPETEMQMGMGFPPIRACLDHGIAPAISTDIVCVGSGDLFSQMRLGLQTQRCLDNHQHHIRGEVVSELSLSVGDALRWATHGSAAALGMEASIGSLTPGKQADVIMLKHQRAMVPSSFPRASSVLQSHAADVDTVIINGQIRKRHGELVGQDMAAIRQRAAQTLARIQQAALGRAEITGAEAVAWLREAERRASVNLAEAYRQ